ncbi:MAG TPA: hypothetical protein VJV03_12465 [Pyrinomonadaceae bacterium]|nr:hypothetical protein [Pyrinomonadaceae bacterium]
MDIYLSGLYSGTNPQPGIGIARSIRQAYPTARIIGVEYSNRCSGIHWDDLDHIWLQRPWEELALDLYADQIKERLDNGAFWISSVDLEIMWLASVFPEGHERLLTPRMSSLQKIAKPEVTGFRELPLQVPPFIDTEKPDWDLHRFCRQHGWKVWLKGPYYEAVRTYGWDSFQNVRAILSNAWSTDRLFLQSHIGGYEESICFAAYEGEIVGSVYMRKRELTEEGKTWAGSVTEVPQEFAAGLRKAVADLRWTGGAELEMVRDTSGQAWLLECNPRFPAWIHGGTISGHNLPALLIEKASGRPSLRPAINGNEFTRVVLEIPVKHDFPLPFLPEPFPGATGHSMKHPAGTLALAKRLQELSVIEGNANDNSDDKKGEPVIVPASFIEDLQSYDFNNIETPSFVFMESTAASVFQRAGRMAKELTTKEVKVINAYSIKTNPDEKLIKLALGAGFLAEAISLLEVQKALQAGYRTDQVILNGPGKWWPNGLLPAKPIRAVFADSIPDLEYTIGLIERNQLRSEIVGVRLRSPGSRFGISLETPEHLATLVETLKALPAECKFGIHFHMASSNIGVKQWWHLYEGMLRWARSVENLTQRRVYCLDIGGGWFPDDWHSESPDRFGRAIQTAKKFLPHVQEIVSEPGKAMAQPANAVAMRVLEFENGENEIKEVVVDGSIAELPMNFFQPHRILHFSTRTGDWTPLARGNTRLLGRLCMEHDIVASNVELPPALSKGDIFVFCDAGAYDRSMSYVFGRG